MKASLVLLAAAVGLLAVVAWLAWSGVGGGAGVEPQRLPGEAPAAPVEVPDPRPTFVPQPGADGPAAWTRLNDLGIEALEAGEIDAAIEAFEACLAANPDEGVYARNLAEALARAAVAQHDAGSVEERLASMALLERAVGLDPSREKLIELLDRWKRSAAAEEGFYVHPTLHFLVSYDLDRNEVRAEIDQVGRLLEDAYLEFGEDFAFWPVEGGQGARIRVVLYTREGFDRVTGIGPWAGGVYDGTIRVPVGDLALELARVRTVLRHELLHAFVQERGGGSVPAWLNEGLAQWRETSQAAERARDIERARAKLKGQELFDLAALGGSLASWTDQEAIERAYAEALSLVGWIAHEYGDRVLYDMVKACGEGVAAEVTFGSAVGRALTDVLQDLAQDL